MTPDLDPNSDAKILQIFLQPFFANQQLEHFQRSYLHPSVIPFWKPLMTPYLDPNSDAKILQIFLQPIFANQQYEHYQRSYTRVLYLFGNLS